MIDIAYFSVDARLSSRGFLRQAPRAGNGSPQYFLEASRVYLQRSLGAGTVPPRHIIDRIIWSGKRFNPLVNLERETGLEFIALVDIAYCKSQLEAK
jgi:hypothetical protein